MLVLIDACVEVGSYWNWESVGAEPCKNLYFVSYDCRTKKENCK